MRTDYVIWDWNGTLLNDVNLCIESINRLLCKEGLAPLPDREAYQRVFQFPVVKYYESVGFDFAKRSFEALAEDYMDYYQPRSLAAPLYEHALEVLEYLKQKGYTQVLLSASKESNLAAQLDHHPIRPYFKDILALDHIHANSKAELAKKYVEKERNKMKSVTFIGDSVHDYEVASYVGANCILIADGHEHIEKLKKTKACVLEQIQQLQRLL